MATVVIVGLSASTKVPGFYGETLFGQSRIRFGSAPLKVLVCGLKHDSLGSISTNTEVKRILNKEDADTYLGAGGEAADMCYAALDEVAGMSGFELYACCPTAAGGAAAATLTITATGTASANGTIKVYPANGIPVDVSVLSGDVQNTVATKINAAIQGHSDYARMPCSSGVGTNVVTLTVKSAGIRGNQHVCYVDFSLAPGVTIALGGAGSATTSSTTVVGRTFGGGTGTETLTTLLTTLYPSWHEFNAIAQNDATSLAAWETQTDSKAGPTEGRTEHFVVGHNGAFAAATSIAQTTLNNQRFALKWLESSEAHPSRVAAAVACLRAALESTTPNRGYDGYAYRTIKPQRFQSDWVTSFAEKQAALDVGVSPLETKADGIVYEVRSITTRCQSGSTPDYRTLDTSQAFVPDRMRYRAQLLWGEFVVANPHVRPDPADSEPDLEEGIAHPALWNAVLYADMQSAEREKLITQVTLNPPSSDYDYTADRIMTAMPVIPLPLQHSIGVSVRQTSITQG